jgi:hypothetical protein
MKKNRLSLPDFQKSLAIHTWKEVELGKTAALDL